MFTIYVTVSFSECMRARVNKLGTHIHQHICIICDLGLHGRLASKNLNVCYCIKRCAKVFNSRALTSEKPCINKEFHAPLMHKYLTFHMQDSGQYSINTEEASRLQLVLSIKQFT